MQANVTNRDPAASKLAARKPDLNKLYMRVLRWDFEELDDAAHDGQQPPEARSAAPCTLKRRWHTPGHSVAAVRAL